MNDEIPNYTTSCLFNTDQSGFNYEFHSGRTLEAKGEKSPSVLIRSQAAITHSYTIQPMIRGDGVLLSPLLICLQEPSGQFGPNVFANMLKPPNVFTVASKSGKLTKEIVKIWVDKCVKTVVDDKALLILDSWNGQNDRSLFSNINVKVLTIPPKATSLVQPLDVYFF